jgi:hypothetical protein
MQLGKRQRLMRVLGLCLIVLAVFEGIWAIVLKEFGLLSIGGSLLILGVILLLLTRVNIDNSTPD